MKIKLTPNIDIQPHRGPLRKPIEALKSGCGDGPPRQTKNRSLGETLRLFEFQRHLSSASTPPTVPVISVTNLPATHTPVGLPLPDFDANALTTAIFDVGREGDGIPKSPPPPDIVFKGPKTEIPKPVDLHSLKINLPPVYRGMPPPLPSVDAPASPAAVRVLTGPQALAAVKKLLANLGTDWQAPTRLPRNADQQMVDWKERLDDTQWAAKLVRASAENVRIPIGCFWQGEPVGMAALELPATTPAPDGLELFMVVTHPGGPGAGSALIERSATESQKLNFDGKLWLMCDVESQARAKFTALGFVGTEGRRKMTLDPSSPGNKGKWVQHEGEWRLSKYLTKEVASGMAGLIVRQD